MLATIAIDVDSDSDRGLLRSLSLIQARLQLIIKNFWSARWLHQDARFVWSTLLHQVNDENCHETNKNLTIEKLEADYVTTVLSMLAVVLPIDKSIKYMCQPENKASGKAYGFVKRL